MAISYPLNTPDSIGIAQIDIRAVNAVAYSQSPFTYVGQTHAYAGQMWQADITVSPVRRDLAAPWKAFLTSLRGQYGTFLLGDPDYKDPQGTVSSCTLTGTLGSQTPTVTMTGSLLAGDYIQLGSGASARLHQVLEDQSGNGDLEIWPALRDDYTDATVIFNSPKGVFRLASNEVSWSINSSNAYSISFGAVEVI
jgi:hypothetical protein